MRLLAAGLFGAAAAAGCAVVLGDYPVTETVMWTAAVLVPVLIGGGANLVAGGHNTFLWVATGPLAAGSLAWGVRIASGWGLDPVPAFAWAAVAVSLLWPPAWGLYSRRRRPGVRPMQTPATRPTRHPASGPNPAGVEDGAGSS